MNSWARLLRHIEPQSAQADTDQIPRQAIALGCIVGWLPCGLVYSTLIWGQQPTATPGFLPG